jgi:D-beta-D-heptose 7-phosphate kinase/D-beta-D-heptose 1-phosphate adenosyltransferase
MERLLEHLAGWKPFTALVVGDFMLDQHVYGDAERLSTDAPVPVLHVRRTESRPGGAANVCMDLTALRGQVEAIGVLGADDSGALLRRELKRQGIGSGGLAVQPDRPTTLKQNLIGLAQARHPQKMFRLDYESRLGISDQVAADLLAGFDARLSDASIVCIEDYAKGVCTEKVCQHVIRAARAAGKPVFVDPARGADYRKYSGATALTPNRTEAEQATGMATSESHSFEHNAELARQIFGQIDVGVVVLTLDRHGALLQERGGEPVAVPTMARTVYDVTGAGDMFLAGVAAARAQGIDWLNAVRFANAAAGLEVEVFGVEPIALERVHHAIRAQTSSGV